MHLVTVTKATIFIDQIFRHDEQRDTLHTCWRIRQTRQNEMNDILAHVMFTVGDVNLLPANAIVIAFRCGGGAQGSKIGARLRFCQVHRPRPFAAVQLWQKCGFLFSVTNNLQRMDRALRQKLT